MLATDVHSGVDIPAWDNSAMDGYAVRGNDLRKRAQRAGAGAAQEALTPLNKEVVQKSGVPGVKAAMDAAGLTGGPVRAPLVDLEEGERSRIAALVTGALREELAGRDRR